MTHTVLKLSGRLIGKGQNTDPGGLDTFFLNQTPSPDSEKTRRLARSGPRLKVAGVQRYVRQPLLVQDSVPESNSM